MNNNIDASNAKIRKVSCSSPKSESRDGQQAEFLRAKRVPTLRERLTVARITYLRTPSRQCPQFHVLYDRFKFFSQG